jgi:uncharacterized membrane protein HdeD (DUF308 family)
MNVEIEVEIMKSLKAIKWLLLVSGVLLIVLGCTMFATPLKTTLAWLSLSASQ